jgi:hypothetical protein
VCAAAPGQRRSLDEAGVEAIVMTPDIWEEIPGMVRRDCKKMPSESTVAFAPQMVFAFRGRRLFRLGFRAAHLCGISSQYSGFRSRLVFFGLRFRKRHVFRLGVLRSAWCVVWDKQPMQMPPTRYRAG